MSSLVLSPPITCRHCGLAVITTKKYEKCPSCAQPLAEVPAASRESSPYDCPVCAELPAACTCLRASVRRRIAVSLRKRAAA